MYLYHNVRKHFKNTTAAATRTEHTGKKVRKQ